MTASHCSFAQHHNIHVSADWLARVLHVLSAWAPAGGCKGVHLHPLEFESDDVICCLQAKCKENFARASGARTVWTESRNKNSKNVQKSLMLLLTKKSSMICVSTNTRAA